MNHLIHFSFCVPTSVCCFLFRHVFVSASVCVCVCFFAETSYSTTSFTLWRKQKVPWCFCPNMSRPPLGETRFCSFCLLRIAWNKEPYEETLPELGDASDLVYIGCSCHKAGCNKNQHEPFQTYLLKWKSYSYEFPVHLHSFDLFFVPRYTHMFDLFFWAGWYPKSFISQFWQVTNETNDWIPLAIPTLKWGGRAPKSWQFYAHQNCSKMVYYIMLLNHVLHFRVVTFVEKKLHQSNPRVWF